MPLPKPWVLAPDLRSHVGGQADVLAVVRSDWEGIFALKRLKKPLRQERLSREIEAMRLLYDAGIRVPPVLGSDPTDRRPWFVMPWYDSGSLDNLIGSDTLTVVAGLRLIGQLAATMMQIHSTNLAHRDLKPANILLASDSSPIVADFGLCLDTADVRLTESWEAVGSRYFIAPENEGGINDELDQRPADSYAFGKIAWTVLAGRRALAREKQLESQYQLSNVRDERLRGVDQLMTSLLSTDPRARLADWSVIGSEIAAVQALFEPRNDPTDKAGGDELVRLTLRAAQSIEARDDVLAARAASENERLFVHKIVPEMETELTYKFVNRHQQFVKAVSGVSPGLTFSASSGGLLLGSVLEMVDIPIGGVREELRRHTSVGSLVVNNYTGRGMRGELWASIYPVIVGREMRLLRVLLMVNREKDRTILLRNGDFPRLSESARVGLPTAEMISEQYIEESCLPIRGAVSRFVQLLAEDCNADQILARFASDPLQ